MLGLGHECRVFNIDLSCLIWTPQNDVPLETNFSREMFEPTMYVLCVCAYWEPSKAVRRVLSVTLSNVCSRDGVRLCN